jgi:TPR repeat protein
MSLRFPIALVLSFLYRATPVCAEYQTGLDAAKRGDWATALREWRPLAEQGNARAQNNLGMLYFRSEAGAQGSVDVQLTRGVGYKNSQGVPQDFVQAHQWYNLAVANGEKCFLMRSMSPSNPD